MANRPDWDWAAVIKAAIAQRLLTLHTHLVCRVVAYNAANQTATLQPEVPYHKYAEDGSYEVVDMPQLPNVPVVWPRFGGFRIVGRLNEGDRVWWECSEVALNRWKSNGGSNDPGDERRFHISDGVCFPGCYDAAHALENAASDHMSMGADTGSTIEIYDNQIKLGGVAAAQAAILGNLFMTALDTLIGAIGTAVGGITPTSGGSAAGTAIGTALSTFNSAASGFLSAIVSLQ